MTELVMEKNHMDKLYKSKNPLVRYVNNKRLKEIVNLLPENRKARILDAGCGEGHLLLKIFNKGYKNICGVDVTKVALESAKKRIEKAKFYLQDISRLKFKDESFDVVICTEVIEHIENYEKVLNGLKRVLKKNGLLIISFPNEPLCMAMRLVFLRNPVVKDHINSFSVSEIKRKINLRLEKRRNLPWNLPDFLSLIYVLAFKNQ